MAFLRTISAIVVAALADPNLTEWKASKQAEEAQAAAEKDRESKMGAVNKAVDLLEDLQSQVLAEGEKEAATYNKFACFCKDTTRDKLTSIQTGEDRKAELIADINSVSSERDQLDDKITDTEVAIKYLAQEMKDATGSRQKTLKLYETNVADLSAALESLRGAIATLKSSKSPSLVQFQSVAETVRTASLMADALGLKVPVLLQQPANEVQMEDYKFHSNDIISTLEGLLMDFGQEKVTVDEDEVSSVKAHQLLMQDMTHTTKLLNTKLDEAHKSRDDKISLIAMNSEEISTVEANLKDDKEYTNKLSKMCSDKAKTWDQRTQARADELATLTQAIGLVSGFVKGNTSASTVRFVQQGVSVRLAKAMAADPGTMNEIEAEAEAEEGVPSFLQQSTHLRGGAAVRLHQKPAASDRDMIIRLLKSEGKELKSTMLTALASKIAADPFSKVKQLIQELIERLLQESANEANQKGWCDKATADATQKRDYAADKILMLNGELGELEAARDQLTEELIALSEDIQGLEDAQQKAVDNRQAESSQNAATILEANEGLSVLSQCIDLLDKFYKTMKKNAVDLSLVQAPSEDAPDAGFDNGQAYTGAQSESGGILGMLDVMKSDFVRTVTETETAEAQAEQDHLEFMTETGKSLAQKKEAEEQKGNQRTGVIEKKADADDDLNSNSDILNQQISELKDLKPACIDTGMSYQDRVARREEEIAALNKAMCILNRYAEYGPSGAADGC